MSDWTAGYVADIGYTYGYYPELNLQRAKLALLNAGIVCPAFGTACELGFGQGVSANIHAAAGTTTWYGTDFNPAQAGFAQELATASGARALLYDDAFAEFASRNDLPDFDYIGLHGIWSWISDENRNVIVDFVRRKLKVGGVLFISYNTLPGWSIFAPMRHLMTQHASIMGNEGQGIVKRIDGALGFCESLLATNPSAAKLNPQLEARFQKVKEMNRHYLAHEYFNRDWRPMYFSELAGRLGEAKMTYGCSARLLEHVDVINLTLEQQKFLHEIPDVLFRETVRDFMRNQQFRCDYWVKGARSLSKLEKDQSLRALRLTLTTAREKIPLKISEGLGELSLKEDLYKPVLDILATLKSHTFEEIAQAVGALGIAAAQLQEILLVMCGAGHVAVAQDDADVSKARSTTARLNTHLIKKSLSGDEIGMLASPVTGGGVAVGRFQKIFLLARAQGFKTPAEWANFTWQKLSVQGQRILKDGKPLHTPEENMAELVAQATTFEQEQLPVLISLGIA